MKTITKAYKYKVTVVFGWDKSIYRTFMSMQKCERYLDSISRKYLPSQIVATWINKVNM